MPLGLCLACHQEIPTESLAVSLLHHAAKYADALRKTNEQHAGLVNKILLFSAWGQAGGAVLTPLAVLGIIGWLVIRRRAKRQAPVAEAAADSERLIQGENDDA